MQEKQTVDSKKKQENRGSVLKNYGHTRQDNTIEKKKKRKRDFGDKRPETRPALSLQPSLVMKILSSSGRT